jgi:iron complex transport system permease protein
MTAGPARVLGLTAAALLVAPWLGHDLGTHADFVLWQLRLPRVGLGAAVGGVLAGVGAAFQVVLHNPLATPSTIGTTAGASLGALAALVLLPGAWGPVVAASALAGALVVTLGVTGLARARGLRTEDLLLAGVAVGLAAGALTTGLQVQADAAATLAAVRWSLGSLATVGWVPAAAMAAVLGLTAAVIGRDLRALQTMSLGSDRAEAAGVDVAATRARVLGIGSAAVGCAVATTGPIGFVGLIVPHLVRLIAGGAPRTLIPLSAVAGAGFLPLCDGIARVALPGRELPVGVLTAALGAPTLLALLLRRR